MMQKYFILNFIEAFFKHGFAFVYMYAFLQNEINEMKYMCTLESTIVWAIGLKAQMYA